MGFYHVNRFLFDIGTVIRPGAWGRPIFGRGYAPRFCQNYELLFREYVLENIRSLKFPEKPSRLECSFLCPSEIAASNFNDTYRGGAEIIYEVELLEEAPMHIAPFTFVELRRDETESAYTLMPQKAEKYWSYTRTNSVIDENILEVLTTSAFRIIKQISDIRFRDAPHA